MIKWLKKLRHSVNDYDRLQGEFETLESEVDSLTSRINYLQECVGDRTTAHIDLSAMGRDPHQIVLIGQYRKHDYVNIYTVDAREFESIREHLQELRRHNRIGRIDASPPMKAVIERDLLETDRRHRGGTWV